MGKKNTQRTNTIDKAKPISREPLLRRSGIFNDDEGIKICKEIGEVDDSSKT